MTRAGTVLHGAGTVTWASSILLTVNPGLGLVLHLRSLFCISSVLTATLIKHNLIKVRALLQLEEIYIEMGWIND